MFKEILAMLYYGLCNKFPYLTKLGIFTLNRLSLVFSKIKLKSSNKRIKAFVSSLNA